MNISQLKKKMLALYEPRDLFNVTNIKKLNDSAYFFPTDFFLHKTPKKKMTKLSVLNSEGMSWCLNTKVTKVTKWLNGI